MADTHDERMLRDIAREIREDWSKAKSGIYFGAVPYLEAMETMNGIDQNYGYDSGVDIVLYFLGNAKTWRGEVAKRIKAELNAMLKRRE